METETISYMAIIRHYRRMERVNRHGWMSETGRSDQTPVAPGKSGSGSLRTWFDAAVAPVRLWIAAHSPWLDQVSAQR